MNVDQMNKLAQSVQSVSQCGFCGRPWFGLVAYCPYCGREPSFAKINQEPDDRPQSDERDESESDEPRKKPRGPLLVKTAIAGLSALLLLWIVVKAPAPKTDEGASPHAISTSRMGRAPRRAPHKCHQHRCHQYKSATSTSAISSTAHRHHGPAPIKQFAMFRGERDGRVVQIAEMSF